MADNSWLGSDNTSDPSTFNYDAAAAKAKRARDTANAIQALSQQNNQGQFLTTPHGTFYAGGNTAGTTIARLAEAALGAWGQGHADDQQAQLATDSNNALQYQMSPGNSPVAQAAAAQQTAREAQAAADRESANMQVQAGQTVNPNVDPAAGQTSPVTGASPLDGPAVTLLPVNVQAAAKALQASGRPVPNGSTPAMAAAAAKALTGGQAPDPIADPMTGLPIGGTPADLPPPGPSQTATPPSPGMPTPTSMLPPPTAQQMSPTTTTGVGNTFQPMGPNGQMPAPQPAMPLAQPTQPQIDPRTGFPVGYTGNGGPIGDSRSDVQQAVANAQPTQAQQVAQLMKIAQTGPMGQQLATAQLNQLYANKNGRFTTEVKPDSVNGGFLKVVTDTATGQTSEQAIGQSGSSLVTGQTTDANGNRLNVHKDGSTTPMLDANGKPVVDTSVTARNDDQTQKIGTAVQSNQNAQAAIDTALNRNQRILQLYQQTYAGPVGGNLPNWTADRQELHALLSQDLFAETRNALAGAGDAGGAPKMAQSEFRYMEHNGGLQQTTDPAAATNIIANMNAQLQAQKSALQLYGQKLQGTSSPGGAVPGRGQTVSAAPYGFR